MGMYTELVMAIELKRDTPTEVIDVLNYLTDTFQKVRPRVNFGHPFFAAERWPFILGGGSAYFPGITNSLLRFDKFAKAYFLTVRSNLKNYDQEIQKFLHWLAPYSQTGTFTPGTSNYPPTGPGRNFAGYYCYEEDEQPTLIYFHEGKVYFAEVGDPELKEIIY